MTGRVFVKLFISFVLVLFIGTAILDFSLRRILEYSLRRQAENSLIDVHATMLLLRRDVLISTLISLALATLIAAFIAHRATRRLDRIVVFASRIAAGELSARVEEGNLDEISEVAHALDATASRLEQSFRALETNRRELEALLDSMQEAVVAVNGQGQVSWSNAVMQRISPSPVREGRSLVHTIRDPEVLACVDGALASREVHRGRATSVAPGRIFEVSAAPTPGGGAVAVLHDVTEIERAEKTRRDFVANVSHELRTPLTSISGYVETLLDGHVSEGDARDFLSIILKNAARVNRLTEDLLALASVESGDYKLKTHPVRASELVHDAIESLAGMVLDSQVNLEAGEATDEFVLADPDSRVRLRVAVALAYARERIQGTEAGIRGGPRRVLLSLLLELCKEL